MIRGVVVGKFYPPHKGHHYLIDAALKNCDQLTVIVCVKEEQTIPGKLRESWLKQIHPKAKVILADDGIPENQSPEDYSNAWADYIVKVLGFVPDVAFTSEKYGERWTRYMGCKHHLVDIKREIVPCSGTMIRNDPMKYSNFLALPVRKYFLDLRSK